MKRLGDGVSFRFDDVAPAAIALLRLALEVAAAGLPAAHVNLEAGQVIERDGDYFGRTVNLAARLAARGAPGEVVVGLGAADAIRDDPRLSLTQLPAVTRRGFGHSQSVWRIEALLE